MKKSLYIGAMAAMLLGTASCSNEMEPVVADGSEVVANFSLNLGDNIDSRAISDGTKADQLTFYVFEDGNEISALRQNVPVTDKHATVTTKLVKGHTYSFVFWAQNSSCTAYAIGNTSIGWIMQVSYQNSPSGYQAPCSDENRDAFYNVLADYNVTESFTEDVVLTRPFAQLNILASDAASVTDFENYTTDLSCSNLSNRMDLLTGVVGTNTSYRSFGKAPLPNESLPGYEQYKLIATGYFLAPTEQVISNVNFTLTYDGHNRGKTIENVPIRRNYRTNIIGDWFTEAANYNIVIDPMYYGELGQVSTWDGVSVEDPVLNEETGNYEVQTAAQLAGFAKMVNDGNTFNGKTVLLNTDINLDEHLWTPIGPSTAKAFMGTFDGQGHTIFKLKVAYGSYGRGFFANIVGSRAVVKNINFNQATVGDRGSGNVFGVVSGYAYGTVRFENITVSNSTVNGFGKIGGILGMAADPGGTTTFKNCKVAFTTLRGTYNIGGIMGLAQNAVEMEDCTVENMNWNIDLTADDCMIVKASDGLKVTKNGETHALEGIWWKYSNWRYVVVGLYYCDYYYTGLPIDGGEEGLMMADGLPHGTVDYPF